MCHKNTLRHCVLTRRALFGKFELVVRYFRLPKAAESLAQSAQDTFSRTQKLDICCKISENSGETPRKQTSILTREFGCTFGRLQPHKSVCRSFSIEEVGIHQKIVNKYQKFLLISNDLYDIYIYIVYTWHILG